MLSSVLAFTFSCAPTVPEDPPIVNPDPDEGKDPTPDEKDPEPASPIVKPVYKDYGRGTKDYSALSYSRPDANRIVGLIDGVREAITENTSSYEEQLEGLRALGDPYEDYMTMMNMAYLFTSRDASNSFWAAEYAYSNTSKAKISKAIDDMYIAAASSPHAERFDADYYGGGLVEDYKDKEPMSDGLVALYEAEAALESEYSSLSTATLIIEVEGKTGTYDELILEAKKLYGETSDKYMLLYYTYQYAYSYAYADKSKEIYLDLIRTRKSIADESGKESYTEIMYEGYGYEYSSDELLDLLSEIGRRIYPAYKLLAQELYSHMSSERPSALTTPMLINNLYSVYSEADSELADAYAYMLQHGLYDIDKASTPNRSEGSFVTYLHSNNSPFIFASVYNDICDYSTLSHEFGHFYDAFTNSGMNNSLEAAEVSSQALEYLTLNMLKGRLKSEQYQYLKYYYISSALETMVYQSIYSAFEHKVYELEYSDINIDNVNAIVGEACEHITGSNQLILMGYAPQDFNSLDNILIPHFIIAPVYVQSYVTSIIPSLDIYFREIEASGSGIEIYKEYIEKSNERLSFVEQLGAVGLNSPFDEGVISRLADQIILHISGKVANFTRAYETAA